MAIDKEISKEIMDWVQFHFQWEFWEEIVVLSVFVLSVIIAGIVRWIKRH